MKNRVPAPEEPYLLGTDPEEGRRLETQHRLWSPEAHDLWDRAGFGPGARLLDLGCGPGFAAVELAHRVGAGGHVLAVDESRRFIETLAREAERRGLPHLEARRERVQALRLEPGCLDGAFARWLFCFLPDPAPVIERVLSGAAAGGPFRGLGLPELPRHEAASAQPGVRPRPRGGVHESWRLTGGDLDVGARLPGLLAAAGCNVVDLVPIVRFARPGTALWEWPTGVLLSVTSRGW